MILERIPNSRYSRVLPLWDGLTVAILAGGPGLTGDLFKACRRARQGDKLRAIAINDSYLLASWADVHYAADAKWHAWHTAGIDKPVLGMKAAEVRERWAAFPGQKCTLQNTEAKVPDTVHVLKHRHSDLWGLSSDPTRIFSGRHGGFQALNIAVLAGAKKILLLGCDARKGENGERHFHGDHPAQTRDEEVFKYMIKSFSCVQNDLKKLGVEVINCSMMSAIETFPKVPFAGAL